MGLHLYVFSTFLVYNPGRFLAFCNTFPIVLSPFLADTGGHSVLFGALLGLKPSVLKSVFSTFHFLRFLGESNRHLGVFSACSLPF